MHPIVLSVLATSALLAAISIIVPLARRLGLPYALVLAYLGILIGLLQYSHIAFSGISADIVGGLREIGLLDDAFIYVFLPPLLFSAGLTIDVRHMMEDLWHVLLLAVVAVVVCTIFVGYGLSLATGIALLPCLLFGTIVSTTDTAAVVNIFREIRAPKRLSAIVEGEALFNDAAAIAMFTLLLAMVTRGENIDFISACREFVLSLLGGAAFGYAIARGCCWLLSSLKDAVTSEVTLTIAAAYFTFVVGSEVLGVSGVVATVTLAVVVSSTGRTRVSPGSWEVLERVWEHLDFWATSLIFVTSAMYVPRALDVFGWEDLSNVVIVFIAAIASRALVIWGMMPTFSVLGASKPLSHSFKTVLWWGGMRGAVTVALALATAATDGISPELRHLVVSTAIGYVVASLTINGLSLRPVIRALKLERLDEHDQILRNRVLTLARRRIRKELRDVAALIGHDAGKLSRSIVPLDENRDQRFATEGGLRVALETWCQREIDSTLALRERGVLTRHHADVLRTHANRLRDALRNRDVEGYRLTIDSSLRPAPTLRISLWFRHTLHWNVLLAAGIADRMERLVGELLVLRDLMQQAKFEGRQLFGNDTAADLHAMFSYRLRRVEGEIKAIEDAYPDFAAAVHRRQLALVALGLVDAEYRRHLFEATISPNVFEELDAQRRSIAAQYGTRPKLEL
jgi:CPA1 family monovalent cation:H+ antiporter